jgi:thiamine biosynthesis protein ThiS
MKTVANRETVSISLNGEARQVPPGSVVDLLAFLDIDPRTVVVEINREIVRRPAMETTYIKESDEIELVHFVGGG